MKFQYLKINTLFIVSLFSLISSFSLFAQQEAPFKVRHQSYINGDMTIIANSIVNREQGRDVTKSPYNETSNKGKLNDELDMQYIDVDDDATTFSSSSATLDLENQGSKKIVYAGLYWSATYLYNSGKINRREKFESIDATRDAFNEVKIKLPNQEGYTTLKGELIFDGINEKNFKESAPYVMFANITDLVLNNKNSFGTYTIANIKATTGKISGGVSAGWTIFFVYEDPSMTGKSITSYDGFAGITDHSVDIPFSGFQTIDKGKVAAKIACAALEGDLKLKGDQLLFRDSASEKFTQLSNSFHDKLNIFNSSITLDDGLFQNRVPNSANTLGYDSFIMTIENPNNEVIGNNTHDAIVRLKTSGDRYYLFFTAFGVEVMGADQTLEKEISQQDNKPTIIPDNLIDKEDSLTQKEVVKNSNSKIPRKSKANAKEIIKKDKDSKILTNNTTIETEKEDKIKNSSTPNTNIETSQTAIIESTKVATTQSEKAISKTAKNEIQQRVREKVIESPSIKVPNLKKGYYLIANVFAKPRNCTRFVAFLKQKGINANYFINPINNYRYVYLDKEPTFEAAATVYDSNLNGKYQDTLWVMTVNE